MASSPSKLVLLDAIATRKMNAWISAPVHKGMVSAAIEAVVVNTDFFFLAMDVSFPGSSLWYKPFSGELLVSCWDEMAPLTA